MGSDGSKIKYDYKVVNDKDDFLDGKEVYGNFLLQIRVSQDRNDEKQKKWWEVPELQMIINIDHVIRVQTLKMSHFYMDYLFSIPFNKDNLQIFIKNPFSFIIDFNNQSKGFQTTISLSDISLSFLNSSLKNNYLEMFDKNKVRMELNYAIIGEEILDDLKKLNLSNIPLDTQITILETAVNKASSFISEFNTTEWKQTIINFLGKDSINTILKSSLKGDSDQFYTMLENLIDDYVNERQKIKAQLKKEFDENEKYLYPVEGAEILVHHLEKSSKKKNEYENLFKKFINYCIKNQESRIYDNQIVYKKLFCMWFKEKKIDIIKTYWNENDINYIFPRNSSLNEKAQIAFNKMLDNSWLFDELVFPMINQKNNEYFLYFKRLISYYPAFPAYCRTFKDKISIHQHKDHPKYYYLSNFFETPEFGILPLSIVDVLKHKEEWQLDGPVLSVMNKYLVEFNKGFYAPLKESKVICLIAENQSKEPLIITNVFLKSHQPIQIFCGPVDQALFLISDKIPTKDLVENFYEFSREKFNNNEIEERNGIRPFACIDLQEKSKEKDYDEIKLEKTVIGKYLIVICKHRTDEKMILIDVVGCLGYKNKNDYEKYNEKLEGDGLRVDLPEGPFVEKDNKNVFNFY